MNVSIIIATFGEEHWSALAHSRALPSAEAQDPFEVLIGHDPEGTISSVRNELAAKAKGDWLCFLDADDELAPGFLDAMQRAFEQEAVTDGNLLLTPAVSYVSRRRREPPKFWGECSFETGNWIVIGTLCPKDLFLKVGGFEDWAIYEDWALWARCAKAGARVIRVPDALYLAHRGTRSRNHALPRREVLRVYAEIQQAVWG